MSAPAHPPLAQSHFASGWEGLTPSSKTRKKRFEWVGFGPRTPAPGPITFRLRLDWLHPVLADSDGVGFETIRYYLFINTIMDLYCDVLRGIATTCDYAVTNCHEIYIHHSQSKT